MFTIRNISTLRYQEYDFAILVANRMHREVKYDCFSRATVQWCFIPNELAACCLSYRLAQCFWRARCIEPPGRFPEWATNYLLAGSIVELERRTVGFEQGAIWGEKPYVFIGAIENCPQSGFAFAQCFLRLPALGDVKCCPTNQCCAAIWPRNRELVDQRIVQNTILLLQ